jgi:peptide/nickel transport system permease protein
MKKIKPDMRELATGDLSELEAREGIAEKSETLLDLYWRRFKKHTLGKVGAIILILLYSTALLADFVSPYDMAYTDKSKSYHPPSKVYFLYGNNEGKTSFRPYTYEKRITNVAFKEYGVVPLYTLRVLSLETRPGKMELRAMSLSKDPVERKADILSQVASYYSIDVDHPALRDFAEQIDSIQDDPRKDVQITLPLLEQRVGDEMEERKVILAKGNKNFIKMFNRGIPYKFLGLFTATTHLFGSPTGGYFPWGTDTLGRDIVSRLIHGSRISLSVGVIGALITFFFGLIIGGLAGYFGGVIDNLLMRFAEVIISFPSLYLLFTLRAAFPSSLNSIQVYLLIVIILSAIGWASLARIIRGLVLSIKNEDFVLSARTMGLSHFKVIRRHILPNTLSYVIVQATITIPSYILGESTLSLLGLGINEPQSSWGLMLRVARNYRVVQDFPWILIPGAAIFLAIMAWNFFGDGIRDAVDPKSKH